MFDKPTNFSDQFFHNNKSQRTKEKTGRRNNTITIIAIISGVIIFFIQIYFAFQLADAFGKGKAVYLGDFFYSPAGARMLLEILLHLTGADGSAAGLTDQFLAECAWFPEAKTLVVMNNSDMPMDVKITLPFGSVQAHPKAEEICFIPIGE